MEWQCDAVTIGAFQVPFAGNVLRVHRWGGAYECLQSAPLEDLLPTMKALLELSYELPL